MNSLRRKQKSVFKSDGGYSENGLANSTINQRLLLRLLTTVGSSREL